MSKQKPSLYFRILQWATVGVFLGRAWQHLVWDAPYRALLWDESWMRGIIEWGLGMEWQEYVTSLEVNAFIQNWISGTGVFYLLCALGAVFLLRLGKVGRLLMYLGAASLILLAGLYCKEKFFFIGQFFEYTLQFGSPILLAIWAKAPQEGLNKRTVLLIKIAIALTFTCHGLYAFGYYPRPGHFVYMTMSILSVGNAEAELFLKVAGILDFILSILLFLPGRSALYASAYATFWGLATTLARPWSALVTAGWEQMMMQWLHEAVMRLPHFLIPLLLAHWLYIQWKKRQPQQGTLLPDFT
jgi:hypothetical protein